MAGEERTSEFLKRIYTAEINAKSAAFSLQAHHSFTQGLGEEGLANNEAAILEGKKLGPLQRIITDFSSQLEQAGIAELTVGTMARYLLPQGQESSLAAPAYHPTPTQDASPNSDSEIPLVVPIVLPQPEQNPRISSQSGDTSSQITDRPNPEDIIRGITSGERWEITPYPDRILTLLRAVDDGIESDLLRVNTHPGDVKNFYQTMNRARKRAGENEKIKLVDGKYKIVNTADLFAPPVPDSQSPNGSQESTSSRALVSQVNHGLAPVVEVVVGVTQIAGTPDGGKGVLSSIPKGDQSNSQSSEINVHRIAADRKRVQFRFAQEILTTIRKANGLVGLSQDPVQILEVVSPEHAIIANQVAYVDQDSAQIRRAFVTDLLAKIEEFWDGRLNPKESLPREQREMIGLLTNLRNSTSHYTKQEVIQLICGHFDFPLPSRYVQPVKKN